MVFVENWKFWNYFSFRKTRERKCLSMFQLVKKAILYNKNVDLVMVKKLKFSKGVSRWFLSKIGNFEIISLLGKQVRESVLQGCIW